MRRPKRCHLITKKTEAGCSGPGSYVSATLLDGQLPTLNERRAPSVLRSIAASFEQLRADNERLSVLAFAAQAGPSVAPRILEFATSDTANCPGGRSCARLYLALQGMAVPLMDTTIGMDMTRLDWWHRAMSEYATGRWGGNEQGVRAIAATQPLIWEEAQAATNAWEKARQEQDVRFLLNGREGADEEQSLHRRSGGEWSGARCRTQDGDGGNDHD